MTALPPTPAAYLASLPADRRAALTLLDRAIRKAAPKLTAKMWQVMGKPVIGYGEFPYTFANGQEGTWFTIGLASNKSNMSLHICVCDASGYLLEKHKAGLGKIKAGRSCANFTKLDDLKLPAVTSLVEKAATAHNLFGQ
jgi:Domain of unknown function (DU1801)